MPKRSNSGLRRYRNLLYAFGLRRRAGATPTRRSFLVFVPITLVLSVLPSALTAGTLGLYADTVGDLRCLSGSASVVDVHVVYTGDPPIEAISFRLPTPSCTGIVGRVDMQPFVTVGTSESGVRIALDGCYAGPVHVLTVRLFSVAPLAYCCAWLPEDVVVLDCDGAEVAFTASLSGFTTTASCAVVAPHSPVPADGAANVPLATELSWQSSGPAACDLGEAWIHVLYFGTDPEALAEYYDVGPPFPIGGLQPGTTYYWQAAGTTYNGAGPYPGPLWRFTTAAPVLAEPSTWGRIKSLYR